MPTTESGGVAIVKNSFWRKVALLQNVPTQALPRTSSRMSYPIEGVVKPTILVVDDTPDNLSLMRELLRKDYQVQLANGGERALKLAAMQPQPDLILLDIMMPVMGGYEVCRRLKADAATRDIPVVFLTAKADVEDEKRGLELGAVDYITKPISPPVVLARVKIHLALKAHADFLRDKSDFLEAEVSKRTREVLAIQDVTILAMATLAETRDLDTGNHIRRTQHYVKALAEKLRTHPRFAGVLTDNYIQMLFKSAPLHDIGKVGIPDHILLRPGRLSPAEFEVMKSHTTLGRDAILQAERALGQEIPFLRFAKEIAYGHHEKWDGSGYPQGLAGEAIPISARLMALCDVFDALISRRVYKSALPYDEAIVLILQGKGKHFDPDVVDAFLKLEAQFRAIATRYADMPPGSLSAGAGMIGPA